jgi:hypothetical protein
MRGVTRLGDGVKRPLMTRPFLDEQERKPRSAEHTDAPGEGPATVRTTRDRAMVCCSHESLARSRCSGRGDRDGPLRLARHRQPGPDSRGRQCFSSHRRLLAAANAFVACQLRYKTVVHVDECGHARHLTARETATPPAPPLRGLLGAPGRDRYARSSLRGRSRPRSRGPQPRFRRAPAPRS